MRWRQMHSLLARINQVVDNASRTKSDERNRFFEAQGLKNANGRKRNRHLVLRETPCPSPQSHMQLLRMHGRIGVVRHDALLRVPLCSPNSPVEKANPGAVPLLSKTSCHAAQAVGGEQEAGHGGAA